MFVETAVYLLMLMLNRSLSRDSFLFIPLHIILCMILYILREVNQPQRSNMNKPAKSVVPAPHKKVEQVYEKNSSFFY